MAKCILWLFVITGFILSIDANQDGTHMGLYSKIAILSSLGILAICESIEKSKKA